MSSRISRLLVATALTAGGVLGVTQLAASGQSVASSLKVVKTVSGPVASGTTFTATVTCDHDIIDDGQGKASNMATVDFDSTGQPTTEPTITFKGGPDSACTVTETATGGAETTTYACESSVTDTTTTTTGASETAQSSDVAVCAAAGPQTDPMVVNVIARDQSATVTIANTFPEPTPAPVTPAAAVVQTPTFTG